MKKPLSKIDSIALTTMTLVIVFLNPDSEIFPSESASAVESSQEIPDDAGLTCQPQSSRDIEPSKSESKSWQCWDYFDITDVNRPWILKKSNIRKTINREICCSVLDEKTGQQ
ncbi:hypothetical protein V1519DRAFT_434278, partial [Lipomyces tetrasporus]